MEILVRTEGGITLYKIDLIGITTDLIKLNHTVGDNQRSLAEVTEKFNESIEIIYRQHRKTNDETTRIGIQMDSIADRMTTIYTDMDLLKHDTLYNNANIADNISANLSNISNISSSFNDLRSQYNELRKELYTQTSSLAHRMKRINIKSNNATMTDSEQVGLIGALLQQNDINIDEGVSELLNSNIRLTTANVVINDNINDLKGELASVKQLIAEYTTRYNNLITSYESIHDRLSGNADSTKIDILSENYRRLSNEVDMIKLDLVSMKSTSSSRPVSRIITRRSTVGFTLDEV